MAARHRWRDLNQTTKHVDLLEDGLRTGVQIPPAPPYDLTKAANDIQLAAFFLWQTYNSQRNGLRGAEPQPNEVERMKGNQDSPSFSRLSPRLMKRPFPRELNCTRVDEWQNRNVIASLHTAIFIATGVS